MRRRETEKRERGGGKKRKGRESVCFTVAATALACLNRGMSGQNWTGVQLVNACLQNAFLSGSDLRGSNLNGVSLNGATIDGVQLQNSTLENVLLGQNPSCLGHTSAVKSVGFSPDGKFIVSGSEDNTVRVWDATNGVEVLQMGRDVLHFLDLGQQTRRPHRLGQVGGFLSRWQVHRLRL